MNNSEKYKSLGKRLLGSAIPMMMMFALCAVLCLSLTSPAAAGNVPQVGSPPVPTAGWQAKMAPGLDIWWRRPPAHREEPYIGYPSYPPDLVEWSSYVPGWR